MLAPCTTGSWARPRARVPRTGAGWESALAYGIGEAAPASGCETTIAKGGKVRLLADVNVLKLSVQFKGHNGRGGRLACLPHAS